jgi:anti-anti-sigma factor
MVSQAHPDITLYKFHGELVLNRDAEQLMEDIQSRMRQHPQRVMIFDFGGLFYVNSQGIGILLKIRQILADQEAGLVVTNMQQHVYSVFSDMGLFRFIFKFDNLYEAFKNYGIASDDSNLVKISLRELFPQLPPLPPRCRPHEGGNHRPVDRDIAFI